MKGDYDDVISALETCEALLDKIPKKHTYEINLRDSGILNLKGALCWYKSELDIALKYQRQSLVLSQRIGYSEGIANSHQFIGHIYLSKGDNKKALEHYKQSLVINERFGNIRWIAGNLMGMGIVYNGNGEIDLASNVFQQALIISEKAGQKEYVAHCLHLLGNIYSQEGDINRSLAYMKRCRIIYEKIGNKTHVASAHMSLGNLYRQKGDLDKSLEHLQQSLEINEAIGNKAIIADSLCNIGLHYRERGDSKRAFDYFKECLSLEEEIKNHFAIANTLFRLIQLSVDGGLIEQAQHYFSKLQDIYRKEENRNVEIFYILSNALILRKSIRSHDKGKAEGILTQLVNQKDVNHNLIIIALLALCEILVAELEISNNHGVVKELEAHISRLLEVATNHGLHWVFVETHVLQSKLALMDLDINEACRLLIEAQEIADDRGLDRLARKISSEHDALLDELSKWEKVREQDLSLFERAELARFNYQINRVSHQGLVNAPEIKDEEPILLLMLGEGGISVFTKRFASSTEVNEQMIAAFLDAIQSFTQEVFSRSLDRIRLEDYTLIITPKEPFTLCYVFRGQSYSAQKKMSRFAEIVPHSPVIWNSLLETTKTGRVIDSATNDAIETVLTDVFLNVQKS